MNRFLQEVQEVQEVPQQVGHFPYSEPAMHRFRDRLSLLFRLCLPKLR